MRHACLDGGAKRTDANLEEIRRVKGDKQKKGK